MVRRSLTRPFDDVNPDRMDSFGNVAAAQGQVQPQPVILLELAGTVAPPAEYSVVRQMSSRDVFQPHIDQGSDASSLLWTDVGSVFPALRVINVTVSEGNVEIAGQYQRLGCIDIGPQSLKPNEFEEVVRVLKLPPVGGISRDHCDVATSSRDVAGLIKGGPIGSIETPLDLIKPDPAQNGHTVPVINPMVGNFIPKVPILSTKIWAVKNLIGAFGLLKKNDVGLMVA